MLSLSQTCGYAILALSCLDESARDWVQAKDVAARTGIPAPYLSKLLHLLAKAKIVRAKRGYQGGFMLVRRADEMSVLEVVQAVEGERWIPRCLLGLADCSDERSCPAHEFWTAERQRIEDRLGGLNLKEVAKFERQFARLRDRGESKLKDSRGRAARNDKGSTGSSSGARGRRTPYV